MHRIALLLAASVLAGCAARPSLVRLDPSPRPARSPADVAVLAEAPAQPYRVIARWSARAASADGVREEQLRRQAVREAARLGADAVVLRFHREAEARMEAAEPGVSVASRVEGRSRLEAEMLVRERS